MSKIDNVNTIVLSRSQFGDKLWEEVSTILRILTKNEEICVVYDDDDEIIVIQHEHNDVHGDERWGCTNPYWLTHKEQEYIDSFRFNKEQEKGREEAN